MSYIVFARTHFIYDSAWVGGRRPALGPPKKISSVETEEQAKILCRTWNVSHVPGSLCLRAEYTESILYGAIAQLGER